MTGLIVNKYSPERSSSQYYLVGNNYSPSTYLLVNKYSLQEISTPLEIVWSVVFLHLNSPGSNILLGNMYSFVPNCRGGMELNCKFWEKFNYLIIVRE